MKNIFLKLMFNILKNYRYSQWVTIFTRKNKIEKTFSQFAR